MVVALHATINLVRAQRSVEIVFLRPPRGRGAGMIQRVDERCRQAGVQRRLRTDALPAQDALPGTNRELMAGRNIAVNMFRQQRGDLLYFY